MSCTDFVYIYRVVFMNGIGGFWYFLAVLWLYKWCFCGDIALLNAV